jgi:Tol biopolymer transport system component
VTTERWRRIEAVCHAALELPAAERAAFVRKECAGEDDMRREVEALLAQAPAADRFLEVSVGATAADVMSSPGALLTGYRLGAFAVGPLLGRGGMGEVYQAFDSELGRNVALKVLPDAVAADSDRLARFKREAHLLASVNHPNIAAIFGLEEAGGVHALVLELVEGPTLADRLAHGPMALGESLAIARQIAAGLEAAHDQGIVHRDLKPANIKVRPDGTVKILDFGLAKATDPAATVASASVTHPGMILGTAPYMSPEQAKSRPADKTDDVWAFGAIVYEMLSGRRAFAGEDVSDALASVLRQNPDWTALPASIPLAVRRLLTRCLERDVSRRLRDIREARIVLEDPARAEQDRSALAGARMTPWRWAAVALVAFGVAAAANGLWPQSEIPSASGPVRFTIAAPPEASFGGPLAGGTGAATQLATSPDGRSLAFVAGDPPAYQIWLRPMSNLESAAIPGTEGGTFPFWSPDSRFIGFFADGKLKKVEISTGQVSVLCDAPSGRGGTWSRDDVIVFAPSNQRGTRLMRVSSAGGQPMSVTRANVNDDEAHAWPHFLLDGRHFIYTASIGICCPPAKPARITVGSLDTSESAVPLFEAESSVSYAGGYLLFGRDRTLMALPFDAETRRITGEAFPIADDVSFEGSRYVSASPSESGTLVYGHGGTLPTAQQLTWFDRAGQIVGTVGDASVYADVALSPDERRIAAAVGSPSNPEIPNRDIWIIDIARNVTSRQTFDQGMDSRPVWSPEGARVVFSAFRAGKVSLRLTHLAGTGEETLLEGPPTTSPDASSGLTPTSWSSDGRYLAYSVMRDVWVLPMSGDRKPFPVVRGPAFETSAVFSPDSRWIAYASDEGGQFNVYVQRFPSGEGKYQVSRGGGSQPQWRQDGQELFYLAPDATLMATPVMASRTFETGPPKRLFPTRAPMPGYGGPTPRFTLYAPVRDGSRFLVATPQPSAAAPMTVIVNWLSAMGK